MQQTQVSTPIGVLVIVVFFILMAFLVRSQSRYIYPPRKVNEATLKGNLHELRNALEQFQADTGAYPQKLTDLIATTAPAKGVDLNGKVIKIKPWAYKGPYLTTQGGIDNSGFPRNPFYSGEDTADLKRDLPMHWSYRNGDVHATVPLSGSTLDNIPYQSL